MMKNKINQHAQNWTQPSLFDTIELTTTKEKK